VTVANCPSCGAPVTFAIGSSAVVVCSFCNSVVARTDRGPELHGIVGALIDTGSRIRVGSAGAYRRQGFRVTGRTQMRHQAGGVWDEWYAAFDDGRWGWLAEAQGRFYLTFPVASDAPPFDELILGGPVATLDGFVVAEIGTAKIVSAEGELPWVPEAGGTYDYADLTGPERRFATIDYGDERPAVFKGSELAAGDLSLEEPGENRSRVQAAALNCSKCGGALELRAPDEAQRIWCPYCGAGHDVEAGKLRYFAMLGKKKVEPVIPLGSTGTIEGDSYVVAGFLERAVRFDQLYYWTEYLLYNREKGYRWLVLSDDHWSFVTPLRPGEVTDAYASDVAKNVQYGGRRYRLFQNATAQVTYVLGEFYWRVEQGESVDTSDYIAPPFGISKEVTTAGAREVSYSHARYMETDEVEEAFGISRLSDGAPVAPMQPFPGGGLGRIYFALLAVFLVMAIGLAIAKPRRVLFERSYDVTALPPTEGAPENGRVVFIDPFEVSGRHNLSVSAESNLSNSWLYVAADIVNESTGALEAFDLPLEYYSGVDGGESWSEGKKRKRVYVSRPAAGRYGMRLELQWEQGKIPPPLRIVVKEGVFRWPHFLAALALLSVPPLFSLFKRIGWEMKRWNESAHSPFGQWTVEDE
jgi:hypothetical protein